MFKSHSERYLPKKFYHDRVKPIVTDDLKYDSNHIEIATNKTGWYHTLSSILDEKLSRHELLADDFLRADNIYFKANDVEGYDGLCHSLRRHESGQSFSDTVEDRGVFCRGETKMPIKRKGPCMIRKPKINVRVEKKEVEQKQRRVDIRLSESERNDMKNIFRLIRASCMSKSGSSMGSILARTKNGLTFKNFKFVLERQGVTFSNEFLKHTFKQICGLQGRAGDTLSVSDYMSLMSIIIHGTSEEKIRFCYQCYDIDGDGLLTQKDIFTCLKMDLDMGVHSDFVRLCALTTEVSKSGSHRSHNAVKYMSKDKSVILRVSDLQPIFRSSTPEILGVLRRTLHYYFKNSNQAFLEEAGKVDPLDVGDLDLLPQIRAFETLAERSNFDKAEIHTLYKKFNAVIPPRSNVWHTRISLQQMTSILQDAMVIKAEDKKAKYCSTFYQAILPPNQKAGISFEELVLGLSSVMCGTQRNQLRFWFHAFATVKGTLKIDGLLAFMESVVLTHNGMKVLEETVGRVIERLMIHQQGDLKWSDFFQTLSEKVEHVDRIMEDLAHFKHNCRAITQREAVMIRQDVNLFREALNLPVLLSNVPKLSPAVEMKVERIIHPAYRKGSQSSSRSSLFPGGTGISRRRLSGMGSSLRVGSSRLLRSDTAKQVLNHHGASSRRRLSIAPKPKKVTRMQVPEEGNRKLAKSASSPRLDTKLGTPFRIEKKVVPPKAKRRGTN